MPGPARDRKSTRLNSSHVEISYAVFCLKKKIVCVVLATLGLRFEAAWLVVAAMAAVTLLSLLSIAAYVRECMRHMGSDEAIFFFIDTATTQIYTLSLHDALPI